jgi:hypothetical protein
MARDPIVDETRRIRDEFAKEHEYDLKKIAHALQRDEVKGGKKVVTPRSQRSLHKQTEKKVG